MASGQAVVKKLLSNAPGPFTRAAQARGGSAGGSVGQWKEDMKRETGGQCVVFHGGA